MKRVLRAFFVGLVVLATTSITAATAIETQDEIAQREYWQEALGRARSDLAVAKQNLNDAQVSYQNMRHRRRVRGEEKQLIIDEVESATAKLWDAQQTLEAATIAARRAGVPPGWFRPPRDRLPASQKQD
jgi:multidrug resistance efflux pump